MKPADPGELEAAAAAKPSRGQGASNAPEEALIDIVRFLARAAAERHYGLFLASQNASYDGAHQEAKS